MSLDFPTLTVELSLDNTVWYTWGSTTNVTSRFRRATFSRGRQRQLNAPRTGELRLLLDNADGHLNPKNASSPYYGSMQPGRLVRLTATYGGAARQQFTGVIMNWPVVPLHGEQLPAVEIFAVDKLAFFGKTRKSKSAYDRVDAVIDDWIGGGGFVGDIALDYGSVNIYDIDSIPGDGLTSGASVTWSVREVLDTIGGSEFESTYFVGGDNVLYWHGRNRRHGVQPVIQAVFDNDAAAQAAGALPYTDATIINDDALIYNQADIAPPAASGVPNGFASDLTSQGLFGTREWPQSTAYTTDPDLLAEQAVARHKDPHSQVETLIVDGVPGSAALWAAILDLQISDPIRIIDRQWPNPSTQIVYDSWIEGADVTIALDPPTWTVNYQLSPWIEGYHSELIGGAGVAFPTSPGAGQRFWRTDLNLDCFFDGTRWLTVQEFTLDFHQFIDQPMSGAGSAGHAPLRSDYNLWLTRAILSTNVQTTNDGSNYWTCAYQDNGGTNRYAQSTNLDAAGTWVRREATVNAELTTSSLSYMRLLTTAKIGSPGAIYLYGQLFYRLKVT